MNKQEIMDELESLSKNARDINENSCACVLSTLLGCMYAYNGSEIELAYMCAKFAKLQRKILMAGNN